MCFIIFVIHLKFLFYSKSHLLKLMKTVHALIYSMRGHTISYGMKRLSIINKGL